MKLCNNTRTRTVEYSLDGDPQIVIREGGKVVSRLEAEATPTSDLDQPGSIMTGDYDFYRPANRFERYPQGTSAGDIRRVDYTLDGDPQVVVERGGKEILRVNAERGWGRAGDAVYTPDGDCYRPSEPARVFNGLDP